jgi:hypothetical protein
MVKVAFPVDVPEVVRGVLLAATAAFGPTAIVVTLGRVSEVMICSPAASAIVALSLASALVVLSANA